MEPGTKQQNHRILDFKDQKKAGGSILNALQSDRASPHPPTSSLSPFCMDTK